jgi:two-component system CheB/CheR fusion protein
VLISVRDDGVGIAPEMLAQLFRPFMQADESLDRSRGGLGLGLALVKGLAEVHGGTAEARSEGVGRGAEFVVTLPLATAGAQQASTAPRSVTLVPSAAATGALAPVRPPAVDAAPEVRPLSRALPPLGGAREISDRTRRILLIEDNVDAAETLKVALDIAGHEVEVAHDGRAGVELAREFCPDVVLCDIGLPEMDGYAVARTLRSDPAFAATALVALTGYGLAGDQSRALDAGFDAHLTKPAPVSHIEETLRTTAPRAAYADGI